MSKKYGAQPHLTQNDYFTSVLDKLDAKRQESEEDSVGKVKEAQKDDSDGDLLSLSENGTDANSITDEQEVEENMEIVQPRSPIRLDFTPVEAQDN